jgi:hypothetical protein
VFAQCFQLLGRLTRVQLLPAAGLAEAARYMAVTEGIINGDDVIYL